MGRKTQAGPYELVRAGLLERLERAVPRIAGLWAPAGFGKSTLLRQWMRGERRLAVCDCTGLHDDLGLARRLFASMAGIVSGDSARTEELLENGGLSVARRVDAALEAWRAVEGGTVIFENAHALAGSDSSLRLLAHLLSGLAPGRRVAIASRVDLRLPLTRLAPPHEIAVLRAADFAFTAGEIAQAFDLDPGGPQVRRILEATGGWPAAVVLLRQSDDWSFEGLHDYAVHEVVGSLDAPLGAALFAYAVVPDATPEDVATACGQAALAALESYAGEAPFVARDLDGRLRLHPLLAALLARGANERRDALLASLAAAYERTQAYERAAQLHAARGDREAAARALAQHTFALDLRPSPAYVGVLRCLDRVHVMAWPALWSAASLQRLYCVDTAVLLDEAESVRRTMSPSAAPRERFWVAFVHALLLGEAGRMEAASAAADELVARFGAAGDPSAARARFLRALVIARLGQIAEAEAIFTALLPAISGMDSLAAGVFLSLGADVARARGERALEREFLDRAAAFARRGDPPNVYALILAESAFGAWLGGDDERFARTAAELANVASEHGVRGFAYFGAAASGRSAQPQPADVPRFVVYGRLIAASSFDGKAQALELERALESAAECGLPFAEVLAAVALAACDPLARERALERAASAAQRCVSAPLREGVEAVAHGRDGGMLAPLLARFSWAREYVAPLELAFSSGSVRAHGRELRLPERESELLFALATRREPAPRARLASMLWPELDERAARNALSVCLHRLRAHAGEDAVQRDGDGYRLGSGVRVDLWELERAMALARSNLPLHPRERAIMERYAQALLSEPPQRMAQWEWFESVARRLDALRNEVTHRLAVDALERGEAAVALAYAQSIVSYDPLDEPARELAIRASLALGDRAAAKRQYRQYRELLLAEMQCEPPAALREMVYA
ncbi:MAG TPA: BTAD domain-containing putative transcriptional regulator [Verrucomicrobiae bacterium]|nr:BTAD domain-containing putative transcriptional regulator [Verrucomicrobiae bacterium]